MLFWCFMLCWVVEKFAPKLNYVFLAFSCFWVVYNGTSYLPRYILGLYGLFYFYCFFYFGVLLYRNRDKLMNSFRKYWCVLIVLSAIPFGRFILFRSIAYTALLFIIFSSDRVQQILYSNKWRREIRCISDCSFGIYIFHHVIIWNISHWNRMYNIIERHYILFPIVLFLFAFLLSWYLTQLCLKTKIGRFLLV